MGVRGVQDLNLNGKLVVAWIAGSVVVIYGKALALLPSRQGTGGAGRRIAGGCQQHEDNRSQESFHGGGFGVIG